MKILQITSPGLKTYATVEYPDKDTERDYPILQWALVDWEDGNPPTVEGMIRPHGYTGLALAKNVEGFHGVYDSEDDIYGRKDGKRC